MPRYTVLFEAKVGKVQWWSGMYKGEKHTRGAAFKRAQQFLQQERYSDFGPVRIYDARTKKSWYLTDKENQ